jgi:drug/metabolite transporter (DMT)-like permease
LLTFGLRTQLLFVAIGAWMMFPRERAIIRTRTYLLGAAILCVGTVGVILGAPGGEAATDVAGTGASWGTMQAHIEGVALALLSGLLFACYGLAVRKYMDGINSVHAFAMICQYTAGAMVVLMLALGADFGMTVLNLPAMEIMWLLLSAVIGIAVGHVFYYMAIARLGVSITAGVLQLQPFIVAVVSMVLFHELLAWSQWISGAVAVAGAGLMLSVQWRISRAKRISLAPLAIAEGESGA